MPDKKPPAPQEIADAAARVHKADLAVAALAASRATVAAKVTADLAAAEKAYREAENEQSAANEALRALMDRM